MDRDEARALFENRLAKVIRAEKGRGSTFPSFGVQQSAAIPGQMADVEQRLEAVAARVQGSSAPAEILRTKNPEFGKVPGALPTGRTSELESSIVALTAQMDQSRRVAQLQVDCVTENTQAVLQGAAAKVAGVISSGQGGIGGLLTSTLKSGLGLAPAITGLFKLFKGGKSEPPPALPAFNLPEPVRADLSLLQSREFAPTNYSQTGLPRPAERSGGMSPQISVNVQTMDSRSFLDHSEDIARAVRDAMLHSHSLNDVIVDL